MAAITAQPICYQLGTGTPKVSVGLPVFNGVKTIERALTSLLNQTFRNIELIISDNGSTDGTDKICKEFVQSDQRVRFFRQPTNRGARDNFNFVLSQARGQYFMWAAADDCWRPSFIHRCAGLLDGRPECGLAMTQWEVAGNWTGPFFRVTRFPSWTPLSDEDAFYRLKYFSSLSHTTHKANFIYGLWRRPLVESVTTRFAVFGESSVYRGLDIAMLYFALTKTPFLVIDDILFTKCYKRVPPHTSLDRLLDVLWRVRYPMRLRQGRTNEIEIIRERKLMLRHALQEAAETNPELLTLLSNPGTL